ncbi:hypothetical protein Sste5346_001291 [Sporothrix stenoceras]|uniref:Uncharacterized protein n=1 Tax=Sporothrix stenoceras TaxID=5173 RepID=A0ABR3ZPH4_9PEZI
MTTAKLTKLGALALLAAGPAMADDAGGCTVGDDTTLDFITRTLGHVTYTLLRPDTSKPWEEFMEQTGFAAIATETGVVTVTNTVTETASVTDTVTETTTVTAPAEKLVTVTATATATDVETIVSTSIEGITVSYVETITSYITTTSTLSALAATTPGIPVDVDKNLAKRDVTTTVTVYGGYGNPLTSTTGSSTTTVSATSTTTIYGTSDYPTGVPPMSISMSMSMPEDSSFTSLPPSTFFTEPTSSLSSSQSACSSGNGTWSTSAPSSASSSISASMTVSVSAESETAPAPSKPTATLTSGSGRAVLETTGGFVTLMAAITFALLN